MKTLTLVVELTYDDDCMHGNDREGIEWFENDILLNKSETKELFLFSNTIGDIIGTVTVFKAGDNH